MQEVKLMIVNIVCTCIEYLRNGKSWIMNGKETFVTSSQMIQSMVSSQVYFQKMGGKAYTSYKDIRSIGTVVDGIDCTSACGSVRRVYLFDYRRAEVINS